MLKIKAKLPHYKPKHPPHNITFTPIILLLYGAIITLSTHSTKECEADAGCVDGEDAFPDLPVAAVVVLLESSYY